MSIQEPSSPASTPACWAPRGRLVMANAVAARRDVLERLDAADSRRIIDLSAISFMDSSGLAVLIAALKTAQGNGGNVVLCGMSTTLRALIELTRLHQVFEIYPDRATAQAQLR